MKTAPASGAARAEGPIRAPDGGRRGSASRPGEEERRRPDPTSIGSPRLIVRPEQPYVSIPIEVTGEEWRRADALFPELFGWIARHGLAMTGDPFFRYWVLGGPDALYGLEAGVPVERRVGGDGRVFGDVIGAGAYLTLIHEGSPEGVERSRGTLREWAVREGIALDLDVVDDREVWGGMYEFQLVRPGSAVHPDRRATEIAYRVRDGGGSLSVEGAG